MARVFDQGLERECRHFPQSSIAGPVIASLEGLGAAHSTEHSGRRTRLTAAAHGSDNASSMITPKLSVRDEADLIDANKDPVLAIAAAGPYWRDATIHRVHVKDIMERLSTRDLSYSEQSEGGPLLEWSNLVLRAVYDNLVNSGLLDTPADI
ncbi:hypothetical protein F4604DRAFT_1686112 [Suillus subluteus]|nr:hypothetical protein F4604DRAFT_1686112 [Suillus subluteus]